MGEYDKDSARHQAPTIAKAMVESDGVSESCPVAELKAMVKVVAAVEIFRGMHEEIAGVADSQTTSQSVEGQGEPTPTHTATAAAVLQDNKPLLQTVTVDTSNKGKQLRRLSRWISYIRGEAKKGYIKPVLVTTVQQRSDPLTKLDFSPSSHWKSIEWLQGSHPAITTLQAAANRRAAQTK